MDGVQNTANFFLIAFKTSGLTTAMHLVNTRFANDSGSIIGIDAASRQNGDSSGGLLLDLPQSVYSLLGGWLLPGGENSVESGRNDLFQGRFPIGASVKSPMKRHS